MVEYKREGHTERCRGRPYKPGEIVCICKDVLPFDVKDIMYTEFRSKTTQETYFILGQCKTKIHPIDLREIKWVVGVLYGQAKLAANRQLKANIEYCQPLEWFADSFERVVEE